MYLILKPFYDFVLSLILLVLFSPVFVLLILLLLVFQNGQIFFLQQRPGMGEKIFKVIKFKTMTDNCEIDGRLMSDEKRLTWIGKFIRKTSIDELPQLFNILRGDMSFIGPRPWLVEYLDLYNDEQKRRHNVKPGISGWAQVNGRNAISWEERFRHDLYYVDNQSFLLDLKIVWMTIINIFKSEGINAKGHATMNKFRGSK